MVTLGNSLPRALVLGALASLLLLSQPSQAIVVAAPAAHSATSMAGAARPQAVQAFLSGRVWSDTDQDGIQDAGELPVANVTINLLDGIGSTLATTTTGAAGVYLFASLGAGEYAIQFIAPTGATFSPQDAGSDDANDSDAIPSTGVTPVSTLGETDSIPHHDAGLLFPTDEELSPEPQAVPKIYLPVVRID